MDIKSMNALDALRVFEDATLRRGACTPAVEAGLTKVLEHIHKVATDGFTGLTFKEATLEPPASPETAELISEHLRIRGFRVIQHSKGDQHLHIVKWGLEDIRENGRLLFPDPVNNKDTDEMETSRSVTRLGPFASNAKTTMTLPGCKVDVELSIDHVSNPDRTVTHRVRCSGNTLGSFRDLGEAVAFYIRTVDQYMYGQLGSVGIALAPSNEPSAPKDDGHNASTQSLPRVRRIATSLLKSNCGEEVEIALEQITSDDIKDRYRVKCRGDTVFIFDKKVDAVMKYNQFVQMYESSTCE